MGGCVRAMPVLQVTNVKASAAHWCDVLGFETHGFWGDDPDAPEFSIVQRGDVTIALDRSREDAIPVNQFWAAYVYVKDADALYEEMKAHGAAIDEPPHDTFYGSREFTVTDPDGHKVAFAHDLNPQDPTPHGLGPERGRDRTAE